MIEDTTAKKVDETIEALCDWIQSELPVTGSMSADAIVPEIVKALAVLVAVRGHVGGEKDERSNKNNPCAQ